MQGLSCPVALPGAEGMVRLQDPTSVLLGWVCTASKGTRAGGHASGLHARWEPPLSLLPHPQSPTPYPSTYLCQLRLPSPEGNH